MRVSADLLQTAAEWHVRLQAERVSEAEIEAFHEWCQKTEHKHAYAEIQRVWGQFEPATNPPARAAIRKVIATPHRAVTGTALALVLTLGISVFYMGATWQRSGWTLSPARWGADYATSIGEIRQIPLSDGSTLILDTQSAVRLHFSDSVRQIELRAGRLQIDVAADPQRPLSIVTRHGRATALGTRYEVTLTAASTRVSVTESAVGACLNSAPTLCQKVAVGQTTHMDAHRVNTPTTTDPHLSVDWNQLRLTVVNQPLGRVLSELAKYQTSPIKWSDQLDEMSVSGVFPLGDSAQALALLEQSLPIRTRRLGPLLTWVEPESE